MEEIKPLPSSLVRGLSGNNYQISRHQDVRASLRASIAATLDIIGEFFDDPGAHSSLEYVDPDPQPVDQPAAWWTLAKLRRIRTGVLYEVRKNADRIDYEVFAADVASRQFRQNPSNLDQIVNEALGFQRSTASRHHLSVVKLADDERSSLLTCWNCGSQMAVGREHLVRAVEHALEYEGDILVSRFRIEVRGSDVPFETKTHRRKSPTPPPPVSFRRGTEFVASGHIPE